MRFSQLCAPPCWWWWKFVIQTDVAICAWDAAMLHSFFGSRMIAVSVIEGSTIWASEFLVPTDFPWAAPALALYPSFLSGHSYFLCLGLLQPKHTMGLPSLLLVVGGAFFWYPGLLIPFGFDLQLWWLQAVSRFGLRAAKLAFLRQPEPQGACHSSSSKNVSSMSTKWTLLPPACWFSIVACRVE